MIQLSKARLRTLLKIHSRNRTSRGEISARRARKQPICGVSPDRAPRATQAYALSKRPGFAKAALTSDAESPHIA